MYLAIRRFLFGGCHVFWHLIKNVAKVCLRCKCHCAYGIPSKWVTPTMRRQLQKHKKSRRPSKLTMFHYTSPSFQWLLCVKVALNWYSWFNHIWYSWFNHIWPSSVHEREKESTWLGTSIEVMITSSLLLITTLMKASFSMGSMHCKTNGRYVWTAREGVHVEKETLFAYIPW